MPPTETTKEDPWFAGKNGTILFYRVNRRPLQNPSLNAEQPDSVMDHLTEVLLFGEVVSSGRGNKRNWLLGNREIADNEETLMGQIGWRRDGSETQDEYDPESKRWVDVTRDRDSSGRSAFCFDSKSRILGVLKHPSFDEKTLPVVFQEIMNMGEQRRSWPSTEWSVEPLPDNKKFTQWLREVDSVQQINLVAKLPNPDGLDEFGKVWEDMNSMRARKIQQVVEAVDSSGLENIQQNERVSNHIAMSERAYGYATARGIRNGRKVVYDQRKNVQRANTDDMPALWPQIMNVIKSHVKARGEKFLRENLRTNE
ncbi:MULTISPECIES: hypothetical protein [unclassified Nocardiopsis]|uniref:hypothetical protein n=1 Tax=unclassified Nocardiopsis TaxID=2649073 RepID=UPI001160FBC4|nr:hypothetical protein [Nocardiopsis sp. TSRI0078]